MQGERERKGIGQKRRAGERGYVHCKGGLIIS